MSATQIKLFGKTICFSGTSETLFGSTFHDDFSKEKEQSLFLEDAISLSSDTKQLEESEFTKESDSSNSIGECLKLPTTSSDYPKTPSFETEADLQNDSITDQSESNSENAPKKPDKILPCPRCHSADTKFCYYNNYNLTQPRYFCKNCQRYWTSGGTMRNVPVGSGRRKNKNAFDPHYHQMMIPQSSQASQAYGKVLDFGSNSHINPCESYVLKPNFSEKSQNCFQNGCHGPEGKALSFGRGEENRDNMSSITSLDSGENGRISHSVVQELATNNFQNSQSVMFYQPPAHWGSNSPGVWSFPCFYPPNYTSQMLGKHPREMERLLEPEENNLWFPKASRIDDPRETAKSSTWSALGRKNERSDIVKGKLVAKAFESDGPYVVGHSLALQANPAALARSHNFHETV